MDEDRGHELHRFLGAIFAQELSFSEKEKILVKEFGIKLEGDRKERLTNMCNLGKGIWEQGIEQGKISGIIETCMKLNMSENDIIEKAKMQAREILLNAKKEANSIISSLNELYNNADAQALKKANSIRNKLNENIKNNNSSTTTNNLSEPSTTLENVTIGMTVLVKTLNQNGTVLTLPNKSNEVQVQIGSMKMTVKTDKLVAIKNNTQKSNNKQKSFSSRNFNNKLKSKTAVTEINVIGETVEEAIFVVDKFLDDSALANLSTVRIVHGKGTGKLRQGIHNFLKTNSHVKSFRLGTFGEGETGVTVVELK